MKKVLVVAGGEWQTPLVARLKKMGFYVLNANLYKDSPGFRYADKTFIADVCDKDKIYEFAKKEKIDGVLTDESDIAVPTVAYIAEKLNLPGITQEKAELFTNKYKMREFCKNNDFASPAYQICGTLQEAEDFLKTYGVIIIKPLDNQSSRGVYRIQNREELQYHFENTRKLSKCEPKVLIEQYISGREFTVDSTVINGKCISLATSLKYQFEHNTNITKTLYFTNESEEYDLNLLKKNNEKLVEAMGLPYGLTHAEYKYMDGRFYLIEIAARGGGTRISSHIVPLMSGVDNYEILIRQTLGEKVNQSFIPDKSYRKRKAVLEFFDFPEGKVEKLRGLEYIKKLSEIIDIHLDFSEGDTIYKPSDDRSRTGFYIAYAEDADTLEVVRQRVKDELKVIYTDRVEEKSR